jgi:hypothetical protein
MFVQQKQVIRGSPCKSQRLEGSDIVAAQRRSDVQATEVAGTGNVPKKEKGQHVRIFGAPAIFNLSMSR